VRGSIPPVAQPGLVDTLAAALEAGGLDLKMWGLAWARFAPTIALVPAFGLRAVPVPARIVLGLALAASIAPAVGSAIDPAQPWPVALLVEAARGLPVALAAAIALWAATMAGGLIDDLRGARERSGLPNVEPGATPTGALLSMLAAIIFLETGGPARVAHALSEPGLGFSDPLARATANLVSGIELAIAIAAPVVVVAIVVEVASALVARAAHPAYVQPILAPLRSIAILGVTALLLDRMLELIATRI
jgi:type III secretory pathway component EscT